MKLAHFSIDDVGLSFKYIFQNSPSTIFDMRLYSALLKWHEEYGLVVSLYSILTVDEFCISNIPNRYRSEFEESKDWLRFGFHSGNEKPFAEDDDYKSSFGKMQEFFEKMGMGCTDTIRLHSWNATDSQEIFLKNRGISTLLMPDDERYTYNNEGIYIKNGIIHRRTDLWFEKEAEISEKSIGLEKEFYVMFTHEWCFDDQKDRIEEALKMLVDNGFSFV